MLSPSGKSIGDDGQSPTILRNAHAQVHKLSGNDKRDPPPHGELASRSVRRALMVSTQHAPSAEAKGKSMEEAKKQDN